MKHNLKYSMNFLVIIYCLLPVMAWSFAVKSFRSSINRSNFASRTTLSAYRILDVPEGVHVKTFAQIAVSHKFGTPLVGKFKLSASIPAETMQKNMDDYVRQMVKNAGGRTIYNGYRNGVIPPSAMKEITGVLVSFGVEQMLVELLNANGLEPCGENKEPVDLGSNEYYDSILLPNKIGFEYEDQKAMWQPGNPFRFIAEFFAIMHGQEADKEVRNEVPSKETGMRLA